MAEQGQGRFAALYDEMKAGGMSRREFTKRALTLGIGMPVIAFVLQAASVSAGPRRRNAGFAVTAQGGAAGRPTFGTEGKTRGQDGELRIIQWQAPTTLSPHVATGTKDFLASSLVLDPLMNYLPDNSLIPNLIKEVPSIENGLLAEDLTSVTYNLLEGVTWSDGEPLTAADVVFTWQWVVNPDNASTAAEVYGVIKSCEAVDDLTVKVTFGEPNANWFNMHAGSTYGYVYPEHILSAEGSHDAFLQKPIGTGPYVVESFSPGDQVVYTANPNYRDPNKPYFETVNLKGGGDAPSAARAVLQTGDYDHAWNLQVEPEVLRQLEQGGEGRLVVAPGNSLERLQLNFSDPNKEVNGQRSEKNTPHPFLTDLAVRRAINLGADRDTIARQFYIAEGEPPTANVLNNTPILGQVETDSPNTTYDFNVEEGARILEEAGWVMDDDVRAKDGVELRLTYATSINSVRQKTQAVVKDGLEEMGFKVQLQQVDSGVFFSGTNEQDINHMYVDINMYTNNPVSPFPVSYMQGWYAGPEGRNIAQRENGWSGQNPQRYNNPEYDALYEELQRTIDIEAAADLLIRMNDLLVNDVAIVPLVNRAADKYAHATSLIHGEDEEGNPQDNVAVSAFETNYWNIANWNRSSEG